MIAFQRTIDRTRLVEGMIGIATWTIIEGDREGIADIKGHLGNEECDLPVLIWFLTGQPIAQTHTVIGDRFFFI